MKRFDRPLPEFLSREDIKGLLDALDTRTWCGQQDRALFTTLYNTGARVSELLHITVRDLVLDGTTAVHIPGEERTERSIPLWRSTASLLL
jgi:integrase/recombinase XerD